jgi:hypothetical protein
MGTTLTGTTPQDTYDSLIKVTDNGPLSGTLKALSDGLGNDSTLSLSTTAASIGGTLAVSGTSSLAVINANGGINGFAGATQNLLIDYSSSSQMTTLTNTELFFGTNAQRRVTITSAGLVGIGTDAPVSKLTLNSGAMGAGANFSVKNFTINGGFGGGYTTGNIQSALALFDSTNYSCDIGYLYDGTGYAMTFATNPAATSSVPTERLRILSSGGLTFNGDTAAANALDDYEEGTFNFGIAFGGSSTGVTYDARLGAYTKIGRQVTITGEIALSSKGAEVGDATITGLPFTIGNGSQFQGGVCFGLSLNITFADMLFARVASNSTTCAFYESTNAGVLTALTNADFANNSQIDISFTYFV